MKPLRVVVALIWMVVATVAQASVAFPLGGNPEGSPKALLTAPSAPAGALGVRTEPSPAPARDAEGLPCPAVPPGSRSAVELSAAEHGVEIVDRLTALPHRLRGPPLPA